MNVDRQMSSEKESQRQRTEKYRWKKIVSVAAK
jgi:hypothetical protein